MKVKIAHIHPASETIESVSGRGGFLGVSVSNPIMATEKIEFLLRWAGSRFPRLGVLVGDFIERHNLLIETVGDMAAAERLAEMRSIPVIQAFERARAGLSDVCFEIITAKSIFDSIRFRDVHSTIVSHFKQNLDFNVTVLADVNRYISRCEKRGQFVGNREFCIQNCVNYVLEELAIFAILVEQGLSVQLYPGRHLQTLSKLSNRHIVSPVFGLNELVCVDLSLIEKL